jgi:hypothetical protein
VAGEANAMMRWEYLSIYLPHDRKSTEKAAGETVERIPQVEAILNDYGDQGWEVVAMAMPQKMSSGVYPQLILKRPKV